MRKAADKVARGMGVRAGERFRESGIPSPNPFAAKQGQAATILAAAWRAGYFAASRSTRRLRHHPTG